VNRFVKKEKKIMDDPKQKEQEKQKPPQQPGQKPGEQQKPEEKKYVEHSGGPVEEQKPGEGSESGESEDSGGEGGEEGPPHLTDVQKLEVEALGGVEGIQQKIEEQAEKNVQDVQLVGFNYSWRGICKKCGWQTHQFSKQQAHNLVKRHGLQHWREFIRQAQAEQQGQQQQQPMESVHSRFAPGQPARGLR
jgi:hypothetical protein